MLRIRFCVALLAMIVAVGPSVLTANDGVLDQTVPTVVESKNRYEVQAATAPLPGGISRAKLYSNVDICTVNPQSRNVGGNAPNPLSVRDWFVTGGGEVTGFDLYVMNGKTSAPDFSHIDMTFFTGTDELNFGTQFLDDGQPAGFTTLVAPFLPAPQARFDTQGRPAIQRVSVDYIARTYSVTDMSSGVVVVDGVDIGDRVGFTLPSGKTGVQVRLTGESSVCQQFGDKTIGVVMAGGGTGNVDGVHIFDASAANSGCNTGSEFDALCRIGWSPTEGDAPDETLVPCDGGNVCSLDRAYNGIALTLYVGPGENGTGNNTIELADLLSPVPGVPDGTTCVGEPGNVSGFLGDNPVGPSVESPLFDTQPNGVIDLLDWGTLQDCFGSFGEPGCDLFDSDNGSDVNLDDFVDFQLCVADINDAACTSEVFSDPDQFQDVDIYEVATAAGEVLQVFVEAQSSPLLGSPSDPLLRVFDSGGTELGRSDDFARGLLDAYTTIEVPSGSSLIYLAVSSATNSDYVATDFNTVDPIGVDEVGGYNLTVRRTNPGCDSAPNNAIECCNIFDQCTGPETEPNETIGDADAIGSVRSRFFTGTIGNGAFAENGQDFDLYKIVFGPVCDPGTPNAGNPCDPAIANSCGTGNAADCDDVTAFEDFRKSMTILIDSEVALGYETIYDTAVALYDSEGRLIALGDQSARPQIDGNDQSRGQLAANIEGPGPKTDADGIYYLAVFGTDRNLYSDDGSCDFLTRADPPTIFNPPHDTQVAGTQEADLRPSVGGRNNLPTDRLFGCLTEEQMNMGDDPVRYQCYQISISTSSGSLAQQSPTDSTETAGPNGNDSIDDATPISAANRLGNDMTPTRAVLGNGRYGAWQGDVDFYRIDNLAAGRLISANMGDRQIQSENHNVRSFMAFFDQDGFVFADQDYSLERSNGTGGIKDEISGTIVGTVPAGITTAFLMVGIDAGRLDLFENTPFDARRPGTTQSRRFGTNVTLARRYNLTVTVMPQVQASAAAGERMFVTTRRGLDGAHTETFLLDPLDERLTSHPPILELDPATGKAIRVLDLSVANVPMFHDPEADPDDFGRLTKVTSRPLIAYDGDVLWVSVEECQNANSANACPSVRRTLSKVDPDETGIGAVEQFGLIEALSTNAVLTGMTELDGILYVLDDANEQIRFWDKGFEASNFNGGRFEGIIEGGGEAFDDLFGDMTTDGTHIMMSCSLTVGNTTTSGICRFLPTIDPVTLANSTLAFVNMIADPVTNRQIVPGPRIGGIEYVGGSIIASDLNGPLLTTWNVSSNSVRGVELDREFFIERITARVPAP